LCTTYGTQGLDQPRKECKILKAYSNLHDLKHCGVILKLQHGTYLGDLWPPIGNMGEISRFCKPRMDLKGFTMVKGGK